MSLRSEKIKAGLSVAFMFCTFGVIIWVACTDSVERKQAFAECKSLGGKIIVVNSVSMCATYQEIPLKSRIP